MLARRHYLKLLAVSPLLAYQAWGAETEQEQSEALAGRELKFTVEEGKFGDAGADDIKAVLLSAGEAIWQHCPHAKWEVPGFFIYRSHESPITDFAHREDGRVAIGLNVGGRQWAQMAYQFAHEFCHALAGHSNQWKEKWLRGRKANHWLEESLCETASLFALRAMGQSWQTKPPYRNWKDYSKSLTGYAQERLDKTAADFPADADFPTWFREHEALLRKNSTQRDWNNIIAARLLPLLEATPSGWESLCYYNLGERASEKTLAAHFRDWRASAPKEQAEFLGKLGTEFGV